MKRKILFSAAVVVLLLSANAFADHRSHGYGGHHGSEKLDKKFFWKLHFLLEHKEDLGLSEEQIQKITAKKFDVKRVLIETQSQKDIAMLDIYQELHSDKPSMEKMNASVDKKIEAKRLAAKTLVEAFVETKKILSSDQLAKSKELFWKEKFSGSPQ